MNAILAGELRVKRGGHNVVPPHHHRLVADHGQDLDLSSHLLHHRGANEDRVNWLDQPGHVQVGLKRLQLAPEGVALHDNVQDSKLDLSGAGGCAGKENHPGTGSQSRHSRVDGVTQRPNQAETICQFSDCG